MNEGYEKRKGYYALRSVEIHATVDPFPAKLGKRNHLLRNVRKHTAYGKEMQHFLIFFYTSAYLAYMGKLTQALNTPCCYIPPANSAR